jgi:hypothetical protein
MQLVNKINSSNEEHLVVLTVLWLVASLQVQANPNLLHAFRVVTAVNLI